MSAYICNFCNNEYGTKKSLILHQKTAKFCLKIQNGMKNGMNRMENHTNNHNHENIEFICDYCSYKTTLKSSLILHNETCKIRLNKLKEENDKKKDELICRLQEENQRYIQEHNDYKTENLLLKKEIKLKDEQYLKELKIKDEINQELKREIESLKNKIDDTYMTFFEKEEKLVDTLLYQNSSSKNTKSINNNLTINNYGIKPITTESVINALESYNTKQKDAFNGYQYGYLDEELDNGSLKVEYVFYGIIRELKDYYGITDISREKIIFNNNGEMTLTTIQEFIRTNVVMNNVDAILEWIYNLLSQVNQRIAEGEIELPGPDGIREMREMTQKEKVKLRDTGKTLEYIYTLFKTSKEKGSANMYMTKWLSDGAMKAGKVIGKLKKNLELKE